MSISCPCCATTSLKDFQVPFVQPLVSKEPGDCKLFLPRFHVTLPITVSFL